MLPRKHSAAFPGRFCSAGTNYGKGMIDVILGIKKMDRTPADPLYLIMTRSKMFWDPKGVYCLGTCSKIKLCDWAQPRG